MEGRVFALAGLFFGAPCFLPLTNTSDLDVMPITHRIDVEQEIMDWYFPVDSSAVLDDSNKMSVLEMSG